MLTVNYYAERLILHAQLLQVLLFLPRGLSNFLSESIYLYNQVNAKKELRVC